MWGQGRVNVQICTDIRIIPTRVGTSCKNLVNLTERQDHPHACGDKFLEPYQGHPVKGSSPRVWGQGNKIFYAFITDGIIPTRVGTRTSPRKIALCSRDHPHACGDKVCPTALKLHSRGSSPRVWGQVRHDLRIYCRNRIIPTRVGTRAVDLSCYRYSQDHPHACGDKRHILTRRLTPQGSSPRVWGQDYA